MAAEQTLGAESVWSAAKLAMFVVVQVFTLTSAYLSKNSAVRTRESRLRRRYFRRTSSEETILTEIFDRFLYTGGMDVFDDGLISSRVDDAVSKMRSDAGVMFGL